MGKLEKASARKPVQEDKTDFLKLEELDGCFIVSDTTIGLEDDAVVGHGWL